MMLAFQVAAGVVDAEAIRQLLELGLEAAKQRQKEKI